MHTEYTHIREAKMMAKVDGVGLDSGMRADIFVGF